MTTRAEKLAVLADAAEELGLADVAAAMRRTDFPEKLDAVLASHRQEMLMKIVMMSLSNTI